MQKYTIQDFQREFPNEDACLQYIFKKRYPDLTGFYRIRGRKGYENKLGKQIYPLKGTIFEKSRTDLTLWFYAIYLFSVSRNGVAAKELSRQLGLTYKAAWRMARQIRTLTKEETGKLRGVVEADETYIGGRHRSSNKFKKKTPVLGIVERGGRVKVRIMTHKDEANIVPYMENNIRTGTRLMTDEAPVYRISERFRREFIKHRDHEYVRGDVHTNTIEGFWGQFKRSLHGTYHSVSKDYLQSYADEFCFRYNHRASSSVFYDLLKRL